MKKYILAVASLVIASSVYADTYKGKPHYNLKSEQVLLNGFEGQAYDDLLRFVDAYHEQIGNDKRYFKGKTRYVKNAQDAIDLVPIHQFLYGDNSGEWTEKMGKTSSDEIAYIPVSSLIKSGKNAIDKELLEKLSFQREGNWKRVYMGNNNTVKDIIIEDTKKFDKSLEEVKKEKNDRYVLLGEYRRVGKKDLDALDISIDEYKSKIEGKDKKDVATFLKGRLEKYTGEKLVQDGANLYSMVDGKKWKIYWNIEPYTEAKNKDDKDEIPFVDKVFTDIYKYEIFDNPKNSAGKLIYTKKGDILVEDRLNQEKEITINGDDLAETIKTAEEGGYNANSKFKEYFKDKKSMSEEDFKKKWVTPFEKSGEYQKDLEAMNKELKPISEKRKKVKKEHDDLDKKLKEIKNNPIFPEDWYIYVDMNNFFDQEEKDKVYNSKTEEQKKLLDEYKKLSPLLSKLWNEENDLGIMEQNTIPEKYGFGDNGKWGRLTINNSRINLSGSAINVELRGKGRVNGTIDLGQGNNRLKVANEFTGKYDSSIILGAYAKLKNIDIFQIGRSVAGRSSLTLDIDPKVKNVEGYLIQHALKDSDKNIRFVSSSVVNVDDPEISIMEPRNDFAIELMTSRLNENSTIDMGRSLKYKIRGLDTRATIVPDSIATTISSKEAKNGNTLLNVEIKDKIKRLTDEENEVYKSIKNGEEIVKLQPTLTTTNKETFFTSYEDDELKKAKKIALIVGLKYKSVEDIYNNSSQFNLDDELKKDILEKLEILKNTPEVQNSVEKSRQFKEMSSLKEFIDLKEDIKKKFELVNNLDKEINFIEVTSTKNLGGIDKEELANKMIAMEKTLSELDTALIEKLSNKYDKIGILNDIKIKINETKEKINKKDWKIAVEKLKNLRADMKSFIAYDDNAINEELLGIINDNNFSESIVFNEMNYTLFYTIKEEEVLKEFKTILNQMKEKNIYSKLNKIGQKEISTYTNLPFDIDHNLFKDMKKNKNYARGGFISSRTVQDFFKGNIYTAYGLYEKKVSQDDILGFMFGGANTDFTEIHPRKMNYVATESTIKGVSAYMGAYLNKEVRPNLNWISGTGVQYGRYNVNRQLKNNYQELVSKGTANLGALNTYTGIVTNFPIHEDVAFEVKGLLSHTFVNQSSVNEKNGLALEVDNKSYNYIDGELGVAVRKTLFDYDMKSSLSAGIYGVVGLWGYSNKDLNARVKNSTSDFKISGDKVKKDALKVFIDYNVQEEDGFNYGLEGTYLTNSEENNVKIGVKAGYVF
ncbi:MAG: autotransporter domain-containing protein [Fusobacterium sp.]|nr:autotransporter domain-containing protein [Fusobacterium sp.]